LGSNTLVTAVTMSLTFAWYRPYRSIVLRAAGRDVGCVPDDLTDFQLKTLEGYDTLDKTTRQSAGLFPILHGHKIEGMAYFGVAEVREAVGGERYEEKFMKSVQFAHNLLQWYRVSLAVMDVEITPNMVYNLSFHIHAANQYFQKEHGVGAMSACLFADYVCFFASMQIRSKKTEKHELEPFLGLVPIGDNNFGIRLLSGHHVYEKQRQEGAVQKIIDYPRVDNLHETFE